MSNDLETFLSSIPQHAQDYVKGRKLDEVECVIADLPGIARGKAFPRQNMRAKDPSTFLIQYFTKRSQGIGAKLPAQKGLLNAI